eukprot:CAMPEP_0180135542 /NCGR_PEP_ID=MMETSP0986-20121125/10907_1 /TAXON_ID=697907 /ORGANISM="non described non described, Strain CCMP2293" /LENGTH=77 /DNA_ID=CAMNT_0022076289 /DNA_START=616 /DNA_END=849 /DNA_ORIENTATION=+
MIDAATMRMLPSAGFDASPPAPGSAARIAETPTVKTPPVTSTMPIQWNISSFRPRKTTDSTPVNTTTEPRSIWKTDG